jgi:UDP-3-O-[3-hydroxymyristoyl] N-acetylglucosamine deacetylase
MLQQTIKSSIQLKGIGLHSGKQCCLTLKPADVDTGILFYRDGKGRIPLSSLSVVNTKLATVIGKTNPVNDKCLNCISTIEHLLATLHGLHIDNLVIEASTEELPIFDGSAKIFLDAILDVGIEKQSKQKLFKYIEKDFLTTKESSYIFATPYNGLILDITIKFDHPLIGHQHFIYDVFKNDFTTIANARTFSTIDQILYAKKAGLIKGGNVDNAIILNKKGVLNGNLRYKDEFVRHKVLDLLGDLYIDGPIKGYIEACCTGHYLNHKLMLALN